MLRLANIEDWQISKDETGKRLRGAAYVIPPESSDSDSDSDTKMNLPLAKLEGIDMKAEHLRMRTTFLY